VYHHAVLDGQKAGKSSYWPQVTVVKDEFAADVDESIWAQQTLRKKSVDYRAYLKQTSLHIPPKACIQHFDAIFGHTCNVECLYKVNISQVSTVSAGFFDT
jgi:hypothetical protein